MKYYKTSKFTKAITSTGFVTVVACVLIAVGAISWFVLSKNNTVADAPPNSSLPQDEYSVSDNSYNSTVDTSSTNDEPIVDVADNVSDVPYDNIATTEPENDKPTFILPISGNISKGYSDTALQYSATYGDMRLHTGIDILCEIGSDIKSVSSGTVTAVSEESNYGRTIVIEYSNDITVKYCGMGSLTVKEGDKVATGDVIGTLGETPCECSDNPHIHIETTVDGNITSPLATLGLE